MDTNFRILFTISSQQYPPPLVLSSLVFMTNVFTAYYFEQYVYSALFLFLTATSVVVHTENNYLTNIIDKFAILSIVLYGGYILRDKLNKKDFLYNSAIISTFLITIYLYVYGFITGQYCFCSDVDMENFYHAMLHIISSFGHHLIIFM
jgi:hypothetical protein